MPRHVLITGGAGFIGAHVASRLLAAGSAVRLLDALHPQVHDGPGRPSYLPPEAELVVGDVRDSAAVRAALRGVDTVIHLAARVGVAQSMYDLAEYSGTNALGTATLLQNLVDSSVERLVVASSMSVYGEGRYVDGAGSCHDDVTRSRGQVEAGRWDPVGADGASMTPVATPESKRADAHSAYALDKYYQERLCLTFGQTYKLPTVALRLFNVYGPYQALSNPYTGVLANFATRLLNGRAPLIFEDGNQRRDFVNVHDAAHAFELALASPGAVGRAINIGSGQSLSVREAATRLASVLDRAELGVDVTGRHRVGDIRHCFADISAARELLGYRPEKDLDQGLRELAGWLEGRVAVDGLEQMAADLAGRGLTV